MWSVVLTEIPNLLSPLTMTVQSKGEPETVLLLTRTRTDARGRRHSVAVPLLPPPDGEKFAGGYQIQVWDSHGYLKMSSVIFISSREIQ